MPKEFKRTDRLGELMQRELAKLIQLEVKDPRLGLVTVNAVSVTRDLAHAKVYITILGDTEKINEGMAVLKRVAGYLRSRLAKQIKIRTIPELHFIYDASVIEGKRLSDLIDHAISMDEDRADQHHEDK